MEMLLLYSKFQTILNLVILAAFSILGRSGTRISVISRNLYLIHESGFSPIVSHRRFAPAMLNAVSAKVIFSECRKAAKLEAH